MAHEDADIAAVTEANLRFYEAFGSLDVDEMEKVWETSDRVLCIHPGWQLVTGWDNIKGSWESIFFNATLMHFIITDTQVTVHQGSAWVSCVENITSVVDGSASNFAIRTTNVFIKGESGWLMVYHHGSG